MRGSVLKRGRTWTYVLPLGRDETTGRHRQKWVGGFATRRDAEAALTEALGRLQAGMWANPGRQTVAEFLKDWLTAVKPSLDVSTWENYGDIIRLYAVPRIGELKLMAFTPARVSKLYSELLESGGRSGGPLSTRTVQYVHTVLGRAFKDAVEWGLLPRNPVRAVKGPKQVKPEMQVWDVEEARRFLAGVVEDRLQAMWLLLLTTGMRRGEIAGLRWSDVDIAGATVAIRNTRTTVGYLVKEAEPKTAKSRRQIALDPVTVEAIKRHRVRQKEEQLAAGPLWEETAYVFVREDGRPYHPQRITELFQELAARVGVPVIRLHDLRHTSASLALAAGVHPKVVQERLGHANIGITLDTYSHVLKGMQEDAAEKLAAVLLAAPSGQEAN